MRSKSTVYKVFENIKPGTKLTLKKCFEQVSIESVDGEIWDWVEGDTHFQSKLEYGKVYTVSKTIISQPYNRLQVFLEETNYNVSRGLGSFWACRFDRVPEEENDCEKEQKEDLFLLSFVIKDGKHKGRIDSYANLTVKELVEKINKLNLNEKDDYSLYNITNHGAEYVLEYRQPFKFVKGVCVTKTPKEMENN